MYENKQKNSSKVEWLFFAIGFLLVSALGFWLTPVILYAHKTQPFNFSHKLHLEEIGSEQCQTCHMFRNDGSFTGIPNLEKCKECHSNEPLGDKIEEKIFIDSYLKDGKEIPWLVYAKQPPCVFFSHVAHIKNAGLDCTKCHGIHAQSNDLRSYEYNRITNYSRDIWGKNSLGISTPPERMKMDSCTECHQENGIRDACFVCHK